VPRYHLSLVWPHSGYAPPPDLSRPELRAAFDAGRANRAVEGDPAAQLERWHQLARAIPASWRRTGPGVARTSGPLPLALDVLLIGVSAVAACTIRQPSSPFRRVAGAIALVASVATFMRSERRGGRSGLTAETAPVPYPPTSMLLQFGIDALYRLWTSRRHGRHFRSPSIEAAAAITRTVMRRRSWRASLPAKST
jgi:hypothetical protein